MILDIQLSDSESVFSGFENIETSLVVGFTEVEPEIDIENVSESSFNMEQLSPTLYFGFGDCSLKPATKVSLGGIIVGDNLDITEDGILSVKTTNNAEHDNTNPITSAGAYTIVGNINVLLKTI